MQGKPSLQGSNIKMLYGTGSMRKYLDLFWKHRAVIVPAITTVLSFLWLVFDFGWEPFVVLIGALITTLTAYQQLEEGWRFAPQGNLYAIHFRGYPSSVLDEFQAQVLALDCGILKWKAQHGGDGDRRLIVLDVIGDMDIDAILDIGRSLKGKTYWISKNGRNVWEVEDI